MDKEKKEDAVKVEQKGTPVQLQEPVFVVTETERVQILELLKVIPLGMSMPIFDFFTKQVRTLNAFMEEEMKKIKANQPPQ